MSLKPNVVLIRILDKFLGFLNQLTNIQDSLQRSTVYIQLQKLLLRSCGNHEIVNLSPVFQSYLIKEKDENGKFEIDFYVLPTPSISKIPLELIKKQVRQYNFSGSD